ncbi:nucleoside triphosphate pyrophosphatase [Aestuariibacter sp. A3R04]|uniref:Maf family protein n=1 Tax=Aestuariibacter sp. A3R04 TaxID=2841571 RepID=UPI001C08A5EF|nr:Maf family protein [Aestuariibacter sp. A3R04]MBU3020646.1 septum formation inhibitor Maf [Aestuariibacter sp. A3R04]
MAKALILASASPRRTALLTQMGFAHQQFAVDIDESPRNGETPLDLVNRLATEKASTAWQRWQGNRAQTVILASDTLIAFEGKPLGKPADKTDYKAMLNALSDNRHQVLTAVSVRDSKRQKTIHVCTYVDFAPLSEEEIEAYWQTGEPADKAGSYAIQGIGGQFVKSVTGSASSVVGLPLYETRCLLKEFGIEQ